MYLKNLEKEKLKHRKREVFNIKTELVEVDNNVEKLGKSKSGSLKRSVKLTTSFQLQWRIRAKMYIIKNKDK